MSQPAAGLRRKVQAWCYARAHRSSPRRAVVLLRLARVVTPRHDDERPAILSALGLALFELFEETGREELVERALAVHRLALPPDSHPDAGLCHTNLVLTLTRLSQYAADVGIVDDAVRHARHAVELAGDDETGSGRWSNLGLALEFRYDRTGDLASLDDAVDAFRRACAVPGYGGKWVPNLVEALLHRHDRTGRAEDIAEAERTTRSALAGTSPGDEGHPHRLSLLADTLTRLPGRHDEAVDLHRRAVEAAPHDAVFANNLVVALLARYRKTGSAGDLDEAVAVGDAAVAAAEAVHLPATLTNLGNALQCRYELTDDVAPLARAAEIAEEVVALALPGADHSGYLLNLSNVQGYLFERTGDPAALNRALEVGARCLEATPDDHSELAGRRVNIGSLLLERFQHAGDDADLTEALRLLRAAVAAEPANVRASCILASALQLHAERWSDVEALAESGEIAARAVALVEDDTAVWDSHVDPGSVFGTLCSATAITYEATGDLGELAASLSFARRAVAQPEPGRLRSATRLDNLATGLLSLYQATGDSDALTESVDTVREALRVVPADHPFRVNLLTNLGNALNAHARRGGGLAAADEAIDCLRRAVSLSGSWKDRWMPQTALACSLHEHRRDDDSALAEAVHAARAAVAAVPDRHSQRGLVLSNLAVVLEGDEAAAAAEAAVRGTPAANPDRAGMLVNLGDLRPAVAVESYREAARSEGAPLRVRLDAAIAWGRAAGRAERWREAVLGFEYAIELLPRLAARHLNRSDQQHLLISTSGLASEAAACALRSGDARRALVLAEHGRGVLLAQNVESRPEHIGALAHEPGLAARFERLSAEFAGAEPPGTTPAAKLRQAERRRRLAEEWAALLRDIRRRPGLDRFLLPPTADELLRRGPVVVVGVSFFGSYALIVNDLVTPVPLPALDPLVVRERAEAFLGALDDIEDADAEPATRSAASAVMRDVLAWLWDGCAEPVLRALGCTGPPSGDWPRVWWSAAGVMAYFPFHAAGNGEHRVLDRVISSYTPTIRALARAHRPRELAAKAGLLVVAPSDPRAGHLPGSRREAEALGRSFPGAVTVLEGDAADRDRVLSELPGHAWVHFSCHGLGDPENPSAGELLVFDSEHRPLTVLDVDRLDLSAAELAFLAACDTAHVGVLPNEAVHLVSACHLAGFRHVIGTLWSVSDRITAAVTHDFYAEVVRGGTPDADRSAESLHHAVRRLRDQWPDHPSVWAAYVHTGG